MVGADGEQNACIENIKVNRVSICKFGCSLVLLPGRTVIMIVQRVALKSGLAGRGGRFSMVANKEALFQTFASELAFNALCAINNTQSSSICLAAYPTTITHTHTYLHIMYMSIYVVYSSCNPLTSIHIQSHILVALRSRLRKNDSLKIN